MIMTDEEVAYFLGLSDHDVNEAKNRKEHPKRLFSDHPLIDRYMTREEEDDV